MALYFCPSNVDIDFEYISISNSVENSDTL